MRPTGARFVILLLAASTLAALAACATDDAAELTSPTAMPAPTATATSPTTVLEPTLASTVATTAPRQCPPVDQSLGPAGLVAFRAKTGEPVWEVEVGAGVTVAATGDVVVVGDPWTTRAFDAATGRPVWCVRGGGHVAAAAGTVVVARAAEPLVGLDPATGEERWRSEVIAPAGVGGVSDPAVGALDLIVVAGQANVYVSGLGAGERIEPTLEAVDAATGRRRWTYRSAVCTAQTGSGASGPPATGCAVGPMRPVEGSLVFVEDVGKLRALDVITGRESWSAKVGLHGAGLAANDAVVVDQVPPRLAGADGVVPPGELVALDPASGVVRWRRPFAGFAAEVSGPLVVSFEQPPTAPGVSIVAFDALAGGVVWQRQLPGVAPTTGPVEVAGLLVLGDTAAPRLVALDPATGADRWVVEHPNPYTDEDHPFDGSYRDLQPAAAGELIVGVIPAEEPQRD